jgi:GNAT superfamily N-acetyltransferase
MPPRLHRIIDHSELDRLAGLSATYGTHGFGFSPEYLARLKEHLAAPHAAQFFALNDDATIAGYAASCELLFPGFLWLEELFVVPEAQGKGVGSQLVARVIEEAKSIPGLRGAMTQTEDDNVPAQRLYEKMGFVRIPNPAWPEGITYRLLFS